MRAREKDVHIQIVAKIEIEVQSSGKSYIKLALTVAAMALWTPVSK